MKEQVTITATVGAFLSDAACKYRGHAVLVAAIQDPEKHRSIVGSLLAYSVSDMELSKWTRVGDATISVTFASHDEQVAAAIRALNRKLDEARAQFLTKQGEILEQISKLQAIEYTPEAQ